jgi:hypothetical protein
MTLIIRPIANENRGMVYALAWIKRDLADND